jgi:hypothetical protein
MIEEVTVAGAPFRLEHIDIPTDKLDLDTDNPRIRYRLSLLSTTKTIDEVILGMPEVTKLRKDIELNEGLREKIIVQRLPNGRFKVLEGNVRTVCYRSLKANPKYKDLHLWDALPARVIPQDVEERKVAILLSDMHVAGKIQWRAHEKAGQIFHMSRHLKMAQGDIATYLRQSKSTVNRLLDAYAFMQDTFFSIENGKYAAEAEYKWSFFDELFRSKELREELRRNTEFGEDFCRWVGEERLPDGANVRDLPKILKHPEAKKKFERASKETAFRDAMKLVQAAEPEEGSDFFKLLSKTREACTNAAQVKEILRIRTDKVARERLIDTYEALRDFMRLADLDPDEIDNRAAAKAA